MGGVPTHGTITDRPWGQTLGALAGEGRRRLTLRSADKLFAMVLDRGLVIEASSPVAVDSILRVAMKTHPMSKVRSEEIRYALAEAQRDADLELEIVTRMLNLTPDQSAAFHRTLVTQRAARTFAVDEGEYELEPMMPSPIVPDGVDVRRVIFIGALMNLSTDRMRVDLLEFGQSFRVKPALLDELDRFGFTPAEQRVVGALRVCSSLAELEAKFREIDSRLARAVVYALASCGGIEPLDVAPPADSRGWDFDEVSEIGTASIAATAAGSDAVPVPLDDEQTMPLAIDQSMLKTFPTDNATTVRPSALSRHEVIELIHELTALLDRGGDHFALLGVSVDAPVESIHAAYVERSRHLSRTRLVELGIVDDGLLAPRLLAQLAIAFTTLTDRGRRSEYIASMARVVAPRATRR